MTIKNDGAFAQGTGKIAEEFGLDAKTKVLAGHYGPFGKKCSIV